ncbi:MAG TPA: PsiF family protein [Steroidobacteraceae bacterium]|jgi:hypothetical protein|nr:PsiF family protein [Steroidobacteraceae bacterium]
MKIGIVLTVLALSGVTLAAEPPATPSATPVKHPSLKACNQQADAKKLTGAARSQFVKECHGGKSA